jgi:hypothetical protein
MQTLNEENAARPTPRPGRWAVPTAGLAIVALLIGVVVLGPSNEPGSNLQLSLGESNPLASCIVFDVETLAGMPVAFQGTVTSVDGSTVTLSIDRWFKGGDAATASLVGGEQSPALIAGFEFRPGSQYLITASDGAVNYCGYSGPLTPELLAGYQAAFAG